MQIAKKTSNSLHFLTAAH